MVFPNRIARSVVFKKARKSYAKWPSVCPQNRLKTYWKEESWYKDPQNDDTDSNDTENEEEEDKEEKNGDNNDDDDSDSDSDTVATQTDDSSFFAL